MNNCEMIAAINLINAVGLLHEIKGSLLTGVCKLIRTEAFKTIYAIEFYPVVDKTHAKITFKLDRSQDDSVPVENKRYWMRVPYESSTTDFTVRYATGKTQATRAITFARAAEVMHLETDNSCIVQYRLNDEDRKVRYFVYPKTESIIANETFPTSAISELDFVEPTGLFSN